MSNLFSEIDRKDLIDALKSIQHTVQWKDGKDIVHLEKRQRMAHIHQFAAISDYDQIILNIVQNGKNAFYAYQTRLGLFYAVRGFNQGAEWLVIFGCGGLMETAFPPEDMDDYLIRRGFVYIGPVSEVLKWI